MYAKGELNHCNCFGMEYALAAYTQKYVKGIPSKCLLMHFNLLHLCTYNESNVFCNLFFHFVTPVLNCEFFKQNTLQVEIKITNSYSDLNLISSIFHLT